MLFLRILRILRQRKVGLDELKRGLKTSAGIWSSIQNLYQLQASAARGGCCGLAMMRQWTRKREKSPADCANIAETASRQ